MMSAPASTSLNRLLGRFHFGITLIAVAISGLTVFLAGIAALRGYAESNLELASRLGAYSVEPALVFNDPVAAREAIVPLTRLPGVARVAVLNADGRSLTEWRRPSGDPSPFVTQMFFPQPMDTRIVRNGANVGQIRLWGDSAALGNYIRASLLGGLACLLVTAVGTILIARRFSKTISDHIAAIADVAHDVRLHRRFDRRVEPLPVAELNRLGRDMNALFDELAGWHRNLEAENATLSRRALQDPLTGLPNRAAFEAHLARHLAEASAAPFEFALLYMDIDRFKATNDQLGHGAGDAVLKAIGKRLADSLHEGDLAARLGGDEFVLVTALGRGRAVAEQLVRRISDAIAAPVDIGTGVAIVPAASIGFACFPRDGGDAAALLEHADRAMYRTKQGKPGTFRH